MDGVRTRERTRDGEEEEEEGVDRPLPEAVGGLGAGELGAEVGAEEGAKYDVVVIVAGAGGGVVTELGADISAVDVIETADVVSAGSVESMSAAAVTVALEDAANGSDKDEADDTASVGVEPAADDDKAETD